MRTEMDCLVLENLIFARKTSPLPDDGSWRKGICFLIDEAFRFCQCILDSCSCAGRRVLSAAHDPWRFFRTWMKGCRSFWANFAQKFFRGRPVAADARTSAGSPAAVLDQFPARFYSNLAAFVRFAFACVAGWPLPEFIREECGNAATRSAFGLLVLCPMNYRG